MVKPQLPVRHFTREELEASRHRGEYVYDYLAAYCALNDSCKRCDHVVRFWCRIANRYISHVRTKRILKICKPSSDLPKEV